MAQNTVSQTRRNFVRYALVTAVLLPVVLFQALSQINRSGQVLSGDTSFAWLPIILFIPTIVIMIAIVLVGLMKRLKPYILWTFAINLIYFVGIIIAFGQSYNEGPTDGVPLTPNTAIVLILSWGIVHLPKIILLYKSRSSQSA